MKLLFILLTSVLLLPAAAVVAQIEIIPDSFFPVDEEFAELHKTSVVAFKDPSRLLKLKEGRLIQAVGFEDYERRSYSVGDSGTVSIEVVSLQDFRAAYSLLTLLRESTIQSGPPGDAFTITADGICFANNREWVRIKASGVPEVLLKRIATSISNRIGSGKPSVPSLVAHLPKSGYDPSTLRYFPGLKSFATFSAKEAAVYEKLNADMEIAQARYSLENRNGDLTLLSCPTIQVAEECYAELTGSSSGATSGNSRFAKRAGALIAILDGSFDPGTADKILSSLRYSYSVRWVYENKPKTIWGLPAGILGTVVKSFFFVVLLSVVSLVAGVAFAFIRFRRRERSSQNSLDRQSEITRLRLQ